MYKLLLLSGLTALALSCQKNGDNDPPAPPPDNPDPDPVEVSMPTVDALATSFMQSYDVPGMALAISKNGKIVYVKGYGVANKQTGDPVTDSSRFRIASVSKPITALAIFKLKEEGKISLDDKVFGDGAILGNTYGSIPYSNDIKSITVRNLLQHTAGGWSNSSNDPMFLSALMSMTQLISYTLDNIPLQNTPGTVYAYSNFGYCLLGRIIEKLSGQSYQDYVKNKLLIPAGIRGMEIAGNLLSERKSKEVVYYGQNGEDPYIYNITRMDSHGGWIASAKDLVKLMLQADGFSTKADLLSAASLKEMTLPSTVEPSYACGWSVNTSNNWWHTGSLPGTASEIVRTSGGYCWAILLNTRSNKSNFVDDIDQLIWKAIGNPATVWPTTDLF